MQVEDGIIEAAKDRAAELGEKLRNFSDFLDRLLAEVGLVAFEVSGDGHCGAYMLELLCRDAAALDVDPTLECATRVRQELSAQWKSIVSDEGRVFAYWASVWDNLMSGDYEGCPPL